MASSELEARKRRKSRIRRKIRGTADCPRLTVYRSLKHIYAQVVDDDLQRTIAQASTLSGGGGKGAVDALAEMSKVEQAKKIGKLVAGLCGAKGIQKVVFDRNGYKYHGRVQAVAAGAREAGLQF